jgi:hypothetical protein
MLRDEIKKYFHMLLPLTILIAITVGYFNSCDNVVGNPSNSSFTKLSVNTDVEG